MIPLIWYNREAHLWLSAGLLAVNHRMRLPRNAHFNHYIAIIT